jgi:hypothetical protein
MSTSVEWKPSELRNLSNVVAPKPKGDPEVPDSIEPKNVSISLGKIGIIRILEGRTIQTEDLHGGTAIGFTSSKAAILCSVHPHSTRAKFRNALAKVFSTKAIFQEYFENENCKIDIVLVMTKEGGLYYPDHRQVFNKEFPNYLRTNAINYDDDYCQISSNSMHGMVGYTDNDKYWMLDYEDSGTQQTG